MSLITHGFLKMISPLFQVPLPVPPPLHRAEPLGAGGKGRVAKSIPNQPGEKFGYFFKEEKSILAIFAFFSRRC